MHFSKQQREGKSCTRALDVCAGRLVMEDCEVTSVCGVGVVVRDGARLEAKRSKVLRCGQNGVFVFDGGCGSMEDCELVDNTFPGLGLDKCDDFRLKSSRVCHGKGDGVKIRGGGEGVMLLDNVISHNGQVNTHMLEYADFMLCLCLFAVKSSLRASFQMTFHQNATCPTTHCVRTLCLAWTNTYFCCLFPGWCECRGGCLPHH
jgi:hypothetical protein